MSSRAFPRYRSSGAVPIGGLTLGIAAGAAAAIALSVMYAYATIYIPFVQIEFLITMGFGAAIGGATAATMDRLHVRARWVIVASAIALGLLGWAFSWLPWLYAMYDVELGVLVHPLFIASAIAEVYEVGTWSLGRGDAMTGVALGAVWLGEMLVIVGCSLAVGMALTKDRVFCERCERWCDLDENHRLFGMEHEDVLRRALMEDGDVTPLASIPILPATNHFLAMKLATCTQCQETHAIAVDEVAIVPDGRGHSQTKRKEKIPFLVLRGSELAELRARLDERRALHEQEKLSA
ncbi:MAG: hypothetical protein M3Y87_10500 [Myxococcota bacterium]|nr:hypothetical protein [Myxococcota bacterium]